ncbi:MAG: hypothetical protein U9N44_00240 [Chloroflexota bacterium]|nr:hypothetical protein [Chloroflexota bacterium]
MWWVFPEAWSVIARSMVSDAPAAKQYYRRAVKCAGDDPDKRLLFNLSDIEVGILQRASDVVMQVIL